MGPRLRRLELTGGSSACEVLERGTAFLWHLSGLTSLDLENCLGGCECACSLWSDCVLGAWLPFSQQLRGLTSLGLEDCLVSCEVCLWLVWAVALLLRTWGAAWVGIQGVLCFSSATACAPG